MNQLLKKLIEKRRRRPLLAVDINQMKIVSTTGKSVWWIRSNKRTAIRKAAREIIDLG